MDIHMHMYICARCQNALMVRRELDVNMNCKNTLTR